MGSHFEFIAYQLQVDVPIDLGALRTGPRFLALSWSGGSDSPRIVRWRRAKALKVQGTARDAALPTMAGRTKPWWSLRQRDVRERAVASRRNPSRGWCRGSVGCSHNTQPAGSSSSCDPASWPSWRRQNARVRERGGDPSGRSTRRISRTARGWSSTPQRTRVRLRRRRHHLRMGGPRREPAGRSSRGTPACTRRSRRLSIGEPCSVIVSDVTPGP